MRTRTRRPALLEVIRALELPLVLIFNRGRVMAMPQGVSKATGLHVALETLRLSPRNTVAIGDAENDHELLRLAEVGVAVAVGQPGTTGGRRRRRSTAAARGRRRLRANALAPTGATADSPRARRRLLLGYTEDGREFSLASAAATCWSTGDAKSGKSWVAGLLCEQLILHGYCVCVIDPEGDYSSLEALPGVTVLGGEDPPPTPRELLRALRYPDRSVVIDLSRLPHDEKIAVHPSRVAGAERPPPANRPSASHPARRSALLPARRMTRPTARLRAQWLHGRHVLRVAAASRRCSPAPR